MIIFYSHPLLLSGVVPDTCVCYWFPHLLDVSLRAHVRLLATALLAMVVFSHGYTLIEETFDRLKNNPQDKLVVFYRSSERDSIDVLDKVKRAVEVLVMFCDSG